jgi:hypothetical protein
MRLIRKFQILLIALALVASGATPRGHAAVSDHAASMHEMNDVPRYSDLAVDPGEDCDHTTSGHHSSDKTPCDNCCAACVSASMIFETPAPFIVGAPRSETIPLIVRTLTGRFIPPDPGVPKPALT